MIKTDRFNPQPSSFIEFHGFFSWRWGGVAMTQRPFIRPHPVEMGYPMHGQLLCSIHFLQFWDSKSWGDIGGVTGFQRYWILNLYMAHRTQTERNKRYSMLLLCRTKNYGTLRWTSTCLYVRLPFFSCKHYLRHTTNNLNIRHTHRCLLRIVPCEPRAHAGLFQTLRTENQQRTSENLLFVFFWLVVRSGLGTIGYLHQMLAIIFMNIDLLVNFPLQGDMSQQKLNCLRHDKDTLGCEHSPIPMFVSQKSPRMAT